MILPADKLQETLVGLVRSLRDSKCQIEQERLATLDIGTEIKVTVQLVTSGGVNAISRTSATKAGEQVQRSQSPEIIETTETGQEIVRDESAPRSLKDITERGYKQYQASGTSGVDSLTVDQTVETT